MPTGRDWYDAVTREGGAWEPGVPLNTHPFDQMAGGCVRFMVEVQDDVTWEGRYRFLTGYGLTWCPPCDVLWDGAETGDRCWFCGRLGVTDAEDPGLWRNYDYALSRSDKINGQAPDSGCDVA